MDTRDLSILVDQIIGKALRRSEAAKLDAYEQSARRWNGGVDPEARILDRIPDGVYIQPTDRGAIIAAEGQLAREMAALLGDVLALRAGAEIAKAREEEAGEVVPIRRPVDLHYHRTTKEPA
jgi:hypothetical protein